MTLLTAQFKEGIKIICYFILFGLINFVSLYLYMHMDQLGKIIDSFTISCVIVIIFIISYIIINNIIDCIYKDDPNDKQLIVLSLVIIYIFIYFSISEWKPELIVAGATLVLVIVTGYNISQSRKYAKMSYMAQNEAFKIQQEALNALTKANEHLIKPIVNVYLKENNNKIEYQDLVIENNGQGIARNLKFTFSPDIITLSGDPINKLHIFQKGIQILSPQQKYSIPIIHFPSLKDKIVGDITESSKIREALKEKLPFILHLNYEDINGSEYLCDFDLDPCFIWGLRRPVKGKTHQDQTPLADCCGNTPLLTDSSGNINPDLPKSRKKSRYEPKY